MSLGLGLGLGLGLRLGMGLGLRRGGLGAEEAAATGSDAGVVRARRGREREVASSGRGVAEIVVVAVAYVGWILEAIALTVTAWVMAVALAVTVRLVVVALPVAETFADTSRIASNYKGGSAELLRLMSGICAGSLAAGVDLLSFFNILRRSAHFVLPLTISTTALLALFSAARRGAALGAGRGGELSRAPRPLALPLDL